MSNSQFEVFKNRYLDSVALLRLSKELSEVDGVDAASAVMATPANLARTAETGVATPTTANPNDLFVGVTGSLEACTRALALARDRVLATRGPQPAIGVGEPARVVSLHQLARRSAEERADIAVISVPGAYAAAEAAKALDLGIHVMLFSDNVSVDDEIELKRLGRQRELLVMGPDCGTAMIDGVPLGFTNLVRRGSIAVLGASGTGMQEVMSRVHNLGAGVSQAIGCGGRDGSEHVGGATMRQALRLIADDDNTDVVVLVSKPPHPSVLPGVLSAAEHCRKEGKAVVAVLIGADESCLTSLRAASIHAVETLAEAADVAVALASGAPAASRTASIQRPAPLSPRGARGMIRGGFVGGTFTHEARAILAACGLAADAQLIDFGDDEYTAGRPHPMIDPSLRDAWLVAALADPTTAVVLFDIVLGMGAHDAPLAGLRRALCTAGTSDVTVIAHVCGTDLDRQGRDGIRSELRSLGVRVADTNAQAALWAAEAVVS